MFEENYFKWFALNCNEYQQLTFYQICLTFCFKKIYSIQNNYFHKNLDLNNYKTM